MATNTLPDTSDTSGTPNRQTTWMERPEFQLVYLPFYFIPWFFATPTAMDVGAALLAVLLFCPLFFRAFGQITPIYLLHALAIEGIALAVGPFSGMEGTYHIYAVSIAAFQQDIRRAIASVVVLSLVYAFFAHFVLEASLARTGFILFMSGIVAATCIAAAQSWIVQDARERSLVLDRQLAAVEERERIARDLHDILGHTLTMVAVKADLAEKLLETDPARARQEISDIRLSARDALNDVRDTVKGMTVVNVAEEIARARDSLTAIDIDFHVSGDVPDLPHRMNKAVGLAIREAVTNIIRHSEATQAQIQFGPATEAFRFSITDNGKGTQHNEVFEPGTGMQSLTRRVEALGGTTEIDTGVGTRLEICLPLNDQATS